MNDDTSRREFLAGAASIAALGMSRFAFADDAVDSPELAASKRWFREAQYGMMVHWGLYSLIGGEWKGSRMSYIGEWAQQYFRIPNAEYARLAKAFNPVCFDADEWVQIARDAGMKYIVFTSKHHDGFAMFRSKVSKFNIADATPFGRDVVEELAEACRRHGMRLGLYYSQDLDWHERGGGGFTRGKTWGRGAGYWCNNWDFENVTHDDFDVYFEGKSKPQVREILTQYGDICLVWFDIGFTLSERQSNELYGLVRKLQPGCLINSRIGCGKCDYTSAPDNKLNDDDKSGMLYEVPATLNDTWGYKPFDQNWKSADEVRKVRERLASLHTNYLLNIGPDSLGRIPAPCVEILHSAAPCLNV